MSDQLIDTCPKCGAKALQGLVMVPVFYSIRNASSNPDYQGWVRDEVMDDDGKVQEIQCTSCYETWERGFFKEDKQGFLIGLYGH